MRIRLRHGDGSIGQNGRHVHLAAGLRQEGLLGSERRDDRVFGREHPPESRLHFREELRGARQVALRQLQPTPENERLIDHHLVAFAYGPGVRALREGDRFWQTSKVEDRAGQIVPEDGLDAARGNIRAADLDGAPEHALGFARLPERTEGEAPIVEQRSRTLGVLAPEGHQAVVCIPKCTVGFSIATRVPVHSARSIANFSCRRSDATPDSIASLRAVSTCAMASLESPAQF